MVVFIHALTGNPADVSPVLNGKIASMRITFFCGQDFGVFCSMIATYSFDPPLWSVSCLSGILAGLVSITASCSVVEPYAAVVIGLIGGMVYYLSSQLLQKLRIDDPLEASPVHFFCGCWGVLAAGFFATKTYITETYGSKYHQLGMKIKAA